MAFNPIISSQEQCDELISKMLYISNNVLHINIDNGYVSITFTNKEKGSITNYIVLPISWWYKLLYAQLQKIINE